MNTDRDPSSAYWHLDKKVPISIIAVLFIQFFGGMWFISKLESRVVALETAKVAQERIDERQDQRAGEAVNLVRSDIHELGRKLDRLVERGVK